MGVMIERMLGESPRPGGPLPMGVMPRPIWESGHYQIYRYYPMLVTYKGKGYAVCDLGEGRYEKLGEFTMEGGGYECAIFCLKSLAQSDEMWAWACENFKGCEDLGGQPREFGTAKDSFRYMVYRVKHFVGGV